MINKVILATLLLFLSISLYALKPSPPPEYTVEVISGSCDVPVVIGHYANWDKNKENQVAPYTYRGGRISANSGNTYFTFPKMNSSIEKEQKEQDVYKFICKCGFKVLAEFGTSAI